LIAKYCQPYFNVITVEEGSLAGGFGAAIMERCEQLGIQNVFFERIGIPDEYVHHGTQDVLRAQYDLHADGIASRVRHFLENRYDAGRWLAVVDEISQRIPDEDLKRMHEKGVDSDHIDEVVYGIRSHVTTK
jgi:hypothetical protein